MIHSIYLKQLPKQYSQSERITGKKYINQQLIKQMNHQIKLTQDGKKKMQTNNNDKQILLTYDGSFVFVSGGRLDHILKNGQIKNQLQYKNSFLLVELITSKIVIIIVQSHFANMRNKAYLVQWDLSTNQTITVQHEKNENYHIMNLFVFPKTQLICIYELFMQSKNFLQQQEDPNIDQRRTEKYCLTYYQHPFKTGQQKPIHIFNTQANQRQKLTNYNICKLNNKSMVGWYSSEFIPQKYTSLIIYSLDEQLNIDKKGKPYRNTYRFQNNFNLYPNFCNSRILDVWEINDKVFYVRVQAQFDISMQKCYSFIWNYTVDRIRPTSFTINGPHLIQFIGQFRKQDRNYRLKLNLQQRQKPKFKSNTPKYRHKLLPVGFVDIHTQNQQKLVCLLKEQEAPVPYQNKFYTYTDIENKNSLYTIDFEYQNAETKNQKRQSKYSEWYNIYDLTIKLNETKLLYLTHTMSEIAAWILQEIIQKCDEDLIFYTCSLVDGQQQDL